MVHLELVDDGQVKVLLDDGLGDVRRQLRVALDLGHRARAIALVGGLKFGRSANGKGRDHAQVEVGGVVVIDQVDHVRCVLFHPGLARLIAFEQRRPIVVAGLAMVNGRANRRHMRGIHRGADARLPFRFCFSSCMRLFHLVCKLFLCIFFPGLPGGGLAHRALRVAAFTDDAVALGAAPAGDHHVTVLLLAHAGHAAGHLLKTQAVGGAEFGQEVNIAAGAHHPVQVAGPHGGALLLGHRPFGQVGVFVLLEAQAVVGLHQAHAKLVQPIAFAALVGVKNRRAGHVQIGFVQGHGGLLESKF